jgi:Tol biopolymer transport system component
MRRLALVATAVAACAAAAWGGGPTAQGAGSDDRREAGLPAEHIVWTQVVDVDFNAARIMVAGPDGESRQRLTHPAGGVFDLDPRVSPDGRMVAFERDDPEGNGHLMLMGIDGRGLREVDVCDDPCFSANGPTWTPDGHHLIFEKVIGPLDPHGNAASALLWKTDLTGEHVVRISPRRLDNVVEDFNAQFGPGGYMVVVRLSLARDRPALFRMRPDGTHACRLTPWALSADTHDVSPATSGPTRDLAVFETYGHNDPPPGKVSAVATVKATCGGDHHIEYVTSPTREPVWHFNPAWSPDGRHLVFVRFKSVDGDPIVHGDLETSRWDGSGRRRIVQGPLFDFRPDWGAASTSS